MAISRCQWCGSDPLYQSYHDKEWGVPQYQDRKLFEMLILEGAQAGLSWITILKKRQNYRKAFDRFRPETIAGYTQRDIRRLMADPGIVRNRLKIEATIHNARSYLQFREQNGRFSDFIWQFVDGAPKTNRWKTVADIPAVTPESDALSKALKQQGFKFIGSTTCYAFMQAAGMVNDHTTDCFRYREIRQLGQSSV
ncbi:MAG: DNA-3-methyladenine glycosylase [Acidithiobacillales bacterium SG8_45]|jgi:DNA-3-methyladenine glycosylase I|nr:MAG: DNA-3-methyladenine glycosylase [Acidithiobacillales bacterium SG8_45]